MVWREWAAVTLCLLSGLTTWIAPSDGACELSIPRVGRADDSQNSEDLVAGPQPTASGEPAFRLIRPVWDFPEFIYSIANFKNILNSEK